MYTDSRIYTDTFWQKLLALFITSWTNKYWPSPKETLCLDDQIGHPTGKKNPGVFRFLDDVYAINDGVDRTYILRG